MSITIKIPAQLRTLTDGSGEIQVGGATVGAALTELNGRFSGLGERLFDEEGKLRRFVNVYVGDEDIRFTKGLDTELSDGQKVTIIPAVAGG
jgi:molybdopterin synthase sulfur carrier subunit